MNAARGRRSGAASYLTFPQLGRVGRLGNQLFQIAATIGLAHRHGMEPRLPTNWAYRKWFSLPGWLFKDVEGTETHWLPDADHLPAEGRPYLQDLSLWEDQTELIRRFFAPSPAAIKSLELDELDDRPRVALHVRRGDYLLSPDHFPVPPLEYYLTAAAKYPEHLVEVYSDDLEWCWKTLVPALGRWPVFVYPGTPRPATYLGYDTAPILDWIDLFLMARCERHIIANSSYSWWGAFLSGDTEAIYPAKWFGPALAHLDPSLMIPQGWRAR